MAIVMLMIMTYKFKYITLKMYVHFVMDEMSIGLASPRLTPSCENGDDNDNDDDDGPEQKGPQIVKINNFIACDFSWAILGRRSRYCFFCMINDQRRASSNID